jgi:hypothetical protein
MGKSSPRNRFSTKDGEQFGRLLFEGQKEGRDERPSTDNDEERQAGDDWNLPELRDQDLQNRKGGGLKMEGYCLKDKRKVEMQDPRPITMKNGKPATVGTCPHCGTKIYRIGKST